MAELELTRSLAIAGCSRCRRSGRCGSVVFSRTATAEDGTSSWQLQRRIEAKSWGKRPVKLTVDDADAVDPGLLLFAAFGGRALAEDAAAATA